MSRRAVSGRGLGLLAAVFMAGALVGGGVTASAAPVPPAPPATTRPAPPPVTRPAPPPVTRPAPPPVTRPAPPSVTRPAPPSAPTQRLMEASNQYAYGRYEKVVTLLRSVVERDLLKTRADRLEALRLYGICLHLTGRKAAALSVFRSLVRQAPRTRLDPRLVQPEVISAFESVRRPLQLKLRRNAHRALARRYTVLNFLPPAGQFQNGQWRKAVVLLGLEVCFLTANLVSFYMLRSTQLRQPDGTFVEKDADGNVVNDRRNLAKALIGINYASLGLLLGTLVYGIVDGLVYNARENGRLRRLIERPLVILPMPTRAGAGIGLTLRY